MQAANDPLIAQLDPPLAAVFGEQTVQLATMAERITALLQPMEAIKLQYTIK